MLDAKLCEQGKCTAGAGTRQAWAAATPPVPAAHYSAGPCPPWASRPARTPCPDWCMTMNTALGGSCARTIETNTGERNLQKRIFQSPAIPFLAVILRINTSNEVITPPPQVRYRIWVRGHPHDTHGLEMCRKRRDSRAPGAALEQRSDDLLLLHARLDGASL